MCINLMDYLSKAFTYILIYKLRKVEKHFKYNDSLNKTLNFLLFNIYINVF